ncbi:type IX secretion system periplasmic lipoprotein PorW/SprE [Flavobacterium psychrotolerans]|uniref:type IX secretion system periplasmic lipoprotein PorW/SprE n=1 Tax=Flavobacterium psychrotolerans TaxID=2169410 RepID=UPI001FB603ED|nr:gliding motility protein [Flavobacterium psychrotolerans]
MKTTSLKYISTLGVILFLIACSTKKNTFLSRNSHALSTEYNILYNGGIALNKGIVDLKEQYKDNFWERLPIERMQINKEVLLPGQTAPNPNFDRAETKSIKAIQKHSMNIGGSEKNPQMDEAHLMLGKARYYDQRFVPALEAFNYILYKYPNSDKIYEAKIWREKTNIRMDNDALAVTNLRKLLKEIKFKDQIFSDANAILSQAFLNLEQKDSAIAKLKLAKEFTKQNEEKARYNFILGQLYEELGYKDSAFASYQTIIDMKRKAARQYVIQAHAKQAQQFDFEKGDTTAFLDKFNHLLKDRENRPYLDVLNHQIALFYDKGKKPELAKKYYNISLKTKSQDPYLVASNYRNLADIYFYKAKYATAGKYYDSTLVQLNARSREFKAIKKKRENLVDVIHYEGIATRNDSIIKVYSLSDQDRISYYEKYILALKKEDEAKKLLQEKEVIQTSSQVGLDSDDDVAPVDSKGKSMTREPVESRKNSLMPPSEINVSQSNFYFYNPTTVAFGKNEFRKIWGDRSFKDNWRISSAKIVADANNIGVDAVAEESEKSKQDKPDPRYSVDYYIKQLPKSLTEIDSIVKERNFAYYQLGVIYKEKFKEYKLAAAKFEQLLENKPEERLVLPTMYNLYKIYQIIDKDKAWVMKDKIISQYPDSRYAQILGNSNSTNASLIETPEESYYKLYKLFKAGDYRTVLTNLGIAIDQFTGDEIIPKFELLKAITIGKINGLEEFKKALNFVALNYPNDEEGKQAEDLLKNNVPKLESLKLYGAKPLSWKILYKAGSPEDKKTIVLQDKIKKFFADRNFAKITMSYDVYTMDKNFIVIHGMNTEEYANGIASILREIKEYKIPDTAYIISSDNYKIVQIKKNFEEYLTTKPTKPLEGPAVNPGIPVNTTEKIVTPAPHKSAKDASLEEDDPEVSPVAPPSDISMPPQELPAAPQEIKKK